jgi:hypothetical protein
MAVIGGAPVPSEDTDAWDGIVAVWERLAAARAIGRELAAATAVR